VTGEDASSAVKVITTLEPAATDAGTLLMVSAKAEEARSKKLVMDLVNMMKCRV